MTPENQSKQLNENILLFGMVTAVTALTIMILTAAPFILHQQQGVAQEEQEQQQRSISNQTPFDMVNPIEDLTFKIDNVTFSHHTASVNGIQMHFVIGGKGDPVVLLHGWPQT